jgi:superfamily II DNA or RNA helicase
MARSVRLRPWQRAALDRLDQAALLGRADFLCVATPGAGKTTFALAAARRHLAAHPGTRLVVVAPTAHLKLQWAAAALRFDLHLATDWSAADGALPSDLHGLVTTYQQVSTSADILAAEAAGAYVILDEVHHAGDDKAWGDAVRMAFQPAMFRLSLSGTPFRSDTRAIPFVRYELDEATPDHEYGYGQALEDGRVVRPVWFPRLDGHMEWTAPDGSLEEATFADALDQARAGQRLRTALSLEGEWLPAVLRSAHQRLVEVRRDQPDAGGLVIASDQEHARGIAALLRERFGVKAGVVLSDDPMASARIAQFAASNDPWLVAVRMVSEGVDIPRLRVGVYATTTTTDLFFRQAVGRLVRWTGGQRINRAWMFIPDDPRLRARAFQIADLRRHSLRKRAERQEVEGDPAALDAEPTEQLSLFAALSATPIGDQPTHEHADAEHHDLDDDGSDDEHGFELELPPLPAPGGGPAPAGVGDGGVATLSRTQQRRILRDRNADRVAELTRKTGWSHAQVNAELNRMSGITRITEATIPQLEKRLRYADRWLNRST